MSKRQVIMLLSAVVAIIQFLGFPSAWNKFFSLVCGLLILGIAYCLAPKVKVFDEGDISFVEHKRKISEEVKSEPAVIANDEAEKQNIMSHDITQVQ